MNNKLKDVDLKPENCGKVIMKIIIKSKTDWNKQLLEGDHDKLDLSNRSWSSVSSDIILILTDPFVRLEMSNIFIF